MLLYVSGTRKYPIVNAAYTSKVLNGHRLYYERFGCYSFFHGVTSPDFWVQFLFYAF